MLFKFLLLVCLSNVSLEFCVQCLAFGVGVGSQYWCFGVLGPSFGQQK